MFLCYNCERRFDPTRADAGSVCPICGADNADHMRRKTPRQCCCLPGDPCDYHAATCTTCYPRCQGHPTK